MFNFNSDLMQTDGGGVTTNSPITVTLTRAQQQAAARKLAAGQPLNDQEKIFLGIPLTSESATAAEDNATADNSAAAKAAADAAAAQAAAEAKAAADKAAADKAAADAAAAAAKTAAEIAAAKAAQEAANKAAADAAAKAAAATAAAKAAADKVAADKAAVDAAGRAERQSAYDLLYSQFSQYGLSSLVEPLKGLITSGASPAEFTIKLRESEPYKRRFSANAQRISKGLKAINEAEYLGLEDQYQSILRNAGMPESYWKRGDLGMQEGFTNFIANDVSAVELEDRVSTAQKRLMYANPEVSIALKTFYPDITNGDLLAYALDPTKGLEQIKRRITAAEVGSTAVQMGLATNVTDAEYLARYGVTKQTAQQGYSTIAGGLQRGSQLASIYGEDPYTQTTAEREVFGVPGAQEAKAQRQKITGLEKATFGGQSGVSSSALARDRAGNF
jgi:hypothetical protein